MVNDGFVLVLFCGCGLLVLLPLFHSNACSTIHNLPRLWVNIIYHIYYNRGLSYKPYFTSVFAIFWKIEQPFESVFHVKHCKKICQGLQYRALGEEVALYIHTTIYNATHLKSPSIFYH